MSPDWADKPEAVPYSSLENPQSLNLYGYVLNNPLSKADPDGHAGCPPDCGDPTAPTVATPSLMDRFMDANIRGAQGLVNLLSHPVVQAYLSIIPGLGGEAEAVSGAASEVEAGTAGAAGDAALGARATTIQGAQDAFGQTKSTTAAASVTDANGNTSVLVGSSRNALTPSQRAALQPGEKAVTGAGHAETTVINAAKAQGMKVNSVGLVVRSAPLAPKQSRTQALSRLPL
jgi:hypothetical protein